eukprot:s6405_g1.t1
MTPDSDEVQFVDEHHSAPDWQLKRLVSAPVRALGACHRMDGRLFESAIEAGMQDLLAQAFSRPSCQLSTKSEGPRSIPALSSHNLLRANPQVSGLRSEVTAVRERQARAAVTTMLSAVAEKPT